MCRLKVWSTQVDFLAYRGIAVGRFARGRKLAVGREKGKMQEQETARLSDSEYRLMDIVWEREPIAAMELAAVCLECFDWKKSTVYTMLKRLGDKGVVLFENKMVSALVKKEQVDQCEREALLRKAYGGSVSNFFAAFLQGRKLTEEEAVKIRKMIEEVQPDE